MTKPARPSSHGSAAGSQAPAAASAAAGAVRLIRRLAQPARLAQHGAIAMRLVYSLRLVAVYERAGRDPVPELANRLGSVDIAAKSLALAHTIAATWPENIHVSRFCCQLATHDEATIAALIDHAEARDHAAFEAQIAGLIRPERVARLWDAVLALVEAELRGG